MPSSIRPSAKLYIFRPHQFGQRELNKTSHAQRSANHLPQTLEAAKPLQTPNSKPRMPLIPTSVKLRNRYEKPRYNPIKDLQETIGEPCFHLGLLKERSRLSPGQRWQKAVEQLGLSGLKVRASRVSELALGQSRGIWFD